MRNVPIAEFKDKMSEYIAAAEAGEEVIITRHGRAAAKLVPVVDTAALRRQRERAAARLAAHRRKMIRDGRTASIEELIAWKNEGRR